MTAIGDAFRNAVGAERVHESYPLSGLTTFKVGGPADWLVEPQTAAELAAVVTAARTADLPITMLGGGSNVLVADSGVRGVVIRPRGGLLELIDDRRVRAEAAVTMNGLVRWTISRGLAGLETWAGTPGTVGGAVYGNAHFGGRLIGDRIAEARLLTLDNRVLDVPAADMRFGYDRSRLQDTGEILLSATFAVSPGNPVELRAIARQSLSFRKRTQPLAAPSAGCIFQNPDPVRDHLPEGMPASAGALVDRAGLKGAVLGGARVSPAHANFIVNDGQATASDIRQLIERCRRAVKEKFGVDLREEIVYLGKF